MSKHEKDLYVIDGHNDLAWQIRKTGDFDLKSVDLLEPQPDFHTDIPRLIKGNVGGQFWSAYVSASTEKTGTAVKDTLEQIALIHRFINKYPEHFGFATTADEIEAQRAQGKIASLIGVEGGYSIDSSIGVLRTFYQLGVRYMTLTHNDTTAWADSATDVSKHNGMTDFGRTVVEEMNRLGMMVDIAHVSWKTMEDVLEVSKAPILSTHSCSCGIAESPRNIPDDILKKIAKKNGLVMTCFASSMANPEAAKGSAHFYEMLQKAKKKFLPESNPNQDAFRDYVLGWLKDNPTPNGTLSDIADHIDHMTNVMGIDHVGIGADFGGCLTLPKGMEDVSMYPNLTKELINRNYSTDDIKKIYHKNILRLMREVESLAQH